MPMLRLLFVILVIVNLVLFSLGQGFLGYGQEGEGDRLSKQLAPEKLRLVRDEKPAPAAVAAPATAPDSTPAPAVAPPAAAAPPVAAAPAAPAAAPAKPAPEAVAKVEPKVEAKPKTPPAPVCRTVPTLTADQAAKALGLLKNVAGVKSVVRELAPTNPSAYWVHLPPEVDRLAAETKVLDLKEKGVQDFFIVQEEGPNRYAISLGLYRQEKGANEYLARLKKLGVAQARITPRGGDARRDLTLNGPADAVDAALAKLNTNLGELRVNACGR